MKALLLHPDRDYDPKQPLPDHADGLVQDLSLDPLLQAMAGGDALVLDVCRRSLLNAPANDLATVRHRQPAVRDALAHPDAVREMYALAAQSIEERRRHFFGLFAHYPSSVLHGAIDMMRMFVGKLRLLRGMAERAAPRFRSPAFSALFETLGREVGEDYLAQAEAHLSALEFRRGVLLSARLGDGLEVTDYVLRKPKEKRPNWLQRLFNSGPPEFTFRLHERDEAGARILGEMLDRGLNEAANALAQATEHVLHFFEMLLVELAYYIGCINLHERLVQRGAPICVPEATPAGSWQRRFEDLRDASLVLSMAGPVAGNTADATGKPLIVITGANQGGKSSFLRSLGLAQLMLQAGLFVAAREFRGDLCTGVFPHYKREEDATMTSGKFDEELSRMNVIADHLRQGALVLFNESFASTNEREGSEVATGIVHALLERGIGVAYVTHMYALSQGFYLHQRDQALFLRAERLADGSRPFSLVSAGPLPTAYGEDLFRLVFGAAEAAGTSTAEA